MNKFRFDAQTVWFFIACCVLASLIYVIAVTCANPIHAQCPEQPGVRIHVPCPKEFTPAQCAAWTQYESQLAASDNFTFEAIRCLKRVIDSIIVTGDTACQVQTRTDSITNCSRESLYVDTRAITIRDNDSVNPARIYMYENPDTAGNNFAELHVGKMTENYWMRLPDSVPYPAQTYFLKTTQTAGNNTVELYFDTVNTDDLPPGAGGSSGCILVVDTLYPCSEDTLLVRFKAIVVKDTAEDGKGASIAMYEDAAAGGQYAGFRVYRSSNSGITTSYLMTLPSDQAVGSEDFLGPGGANYGTGSVSGNSELVADANGDLYWMDRDNFKRVQCDTIIADTSVGDGAITIEAETIYLKSDTARIIDGQWGGSQLKIIWSEDALNGSSTITLRPDDNIEDSWTLVLPDSSAKWEPSQWRFNKGGIASPYWVPFDDQYTVWGEDTVTCNVSTYVAKISTSRCPATRSPLPGQAMPFKSLRSYYPTVEWVVANSDSAIAGDYWVADGARIVGRPAPSDARSNELYVLSGFDKDAMSDNENGDPRYTSDSTFTIHVPTIGCDTIMVIRWMAVGWLSEHLGEGH